MVAPLAISAEIFMDSLIIESLISIIPLKIFSLQTRGPNSYLLDTNGPVTLLQENLSIKKCRNGLCVNNVYCIQACASGGTICMII